MTTINRICATLAYAKPSDWLAGGVVGVAYAALVFWIGGAA